MKDREIHSEEFSRLKKAWEDQGFEVYEQPSQFRDLLPLKGYIPDLVLKAEENYFAVEIVNDRKLMKTHRINQMREAIDSIPNWNFVVYLIDDNAPPSELKRPIKHQINEMLDHAERQALQHQPIFALLLAWTTLEAAARFNHPIVFAKPHTPSTLVARLAERGEITPDEADSLRDLGQIRNKIVHGDYSPSIPRDAVLNLISVVRALLK